MTAYREMAAHAWNENSVRLFNTPSDFAKSSLLYVQEVGHFFTQPPYFTEREHLNSFLIVYTVSGAGKLIYGNKTYSLLANQLFFIDCMNYQYYASSKDDNWEILWVHLNGVSARAYYEQFANRDDPCQICPPNAQISATLLQLIELHHFKSMRNELLASKALVGLLTEILLVDSNSNSLHQEVPTYVTGILQLIDKRYNEKLTLNELSKLFAINKYHLAKMFKKYTGFSPGDFIINTRITKAKELLKYSDLTVSEISNGVGIDNISHFINLFKDRTGLTPLAFRKSWQAPR